MPSMRLRSPKPRFVRRCESGFGIGGQYKQFQSPASAWGLSSIVAHQARAHPQTDGALTEEPRSHRLIFIDDRVCYRLPVEHLTGTDTGVYARSLLINEKAAMKGGCRQNWVPQAEVILLARAWAVGSAPCVGCDWQAEPPAPPRQSKQLQHGGTGGFACRTTFHTDSDAWGFHRYTSTIVHRDTHLNLQKCALKLFGLGAKS